MPTVVQHTLVILLQDQTKKNNRKIGKKKQILNILKPLGIFTFKCAVILLNSLIRSIVLYGAEILHNITESEMRGIEQIEEDQKRNIFQVKTGIQVPIHLMYLELGQAPARFQVQRLILNILQYILQQKETSLLHKNSPKTEPKKGDWVLEVSESLKSLGINLEFEEIKIMTRKCIRKLTKTKAFKAAFLDLKRKQENGSKGQTLRYGKSLAMADYLCPSNQLSVQDQRDLFQIRSRTNPLPANRGNPCCVCVGEYKIIIIYYNVILQILKRRLKLKY